MEFYLKAREHFAKLQQNQHWPSVESDSFGG
jgi:hypothetical protein